ncbi:tetratricopeptide repeat protein [Streptomyces sp. NPDC060022]|uniref:tetratricopeptide repeat protein n=1 Tax=Streptomyces sp. NPDC060022 TaxID=3347039 RepID=UPI003692CE64
MSHLRYDAEAVPVFEHARALLRETGDRDREGRMNRNLGHSLRSLRKYPEAISAYRLARTLFREAGLPAREGNVCRDLGKVFRQSGRVAEAAAAYREAIVLFTESGRERELDETKRLLHHLIEPTTSTPKDR